MIKLCALMRAKQRDEAHETSLPYNIIVIDGNAIDRVRQAKVLGVTISADLCWNAHVGTIITKARKRVFIICQPPVRAAVRGVADRICQACQPRSARRCVV